MAIMKDHNKKAGTDVPAFSVIFYSDLHCLSTRLQDHLCNHLREGRRPDISNYLSNGFTIKAWLR